MWGATGTRCVGGRDPRPGFRGRSAGKPEGAALLGDSDLLGLMSAPGLRGWFCLPHVPLISLLTAGFTCVHWTRVCPLVLGTEGMELMCSGGPGAPGSWVMGLSQPPGPIPMSLFLLSTEMPPWW